MLGGFPVIYGINPHQEETVPQHVLGTMGVTSDGRIFRYAQAGATALVAGDLVQSPAETADSQSLIVAAAAVGAMTVTTTDTTTVTANEFADGYLIVTGEASTGTGFQYRIKSHPAATAAAVTLTLYEPVVVAMTATTQIDLVHNPYNGVIQWPVTQTGAPVGVARRALAIDAYGWIQTGGPGAVLTTGTVAVGANVSAATATAGAVETATAALPTIGFALTGIASGEVGAVHLIID